ncbi:NmrA family NAD(P)-binding protein [Alkalihalobacillus sp. 1P02AB]|uniref:NmrA family NAD(P)-binding protein n=1 Tax=Alkalihalobacillus sp. 1P02AB TaxID=3132260 RepID=UPI0039A46693
MKVLVTGASGNVGRFVTQKLLRLGEQVVVAGTDLEKLERLFSDSVCKVVLDFTDPHTFSEALKGIDRVFLMRPPYLGKPEQMYPFIDAMKKHNIKFVSFLSLMGIENNKFPPHHKIEKYIEAKGFHYSHIRPGFFMQNISGIHAVEIRELNQIFIPAGKSKTSFVDAEDVGLAVATVLHQPEKYKDTSYTITGAEALNYDQIATILTEITGHKILYTRPGFLKYRNHYVKKRGLAKSYVNITLMLYFMTRIGTAQSITNDFMELTDKQPSSFKEFAQKNKEKFI